MKELVKVNNDTLITELKTVCEMFNKQHRNVMRDIRNILKDLPQLECEFIPQQFTTSSGNKYNTYYLTEKGFYILTSSFKGTKARVWQSKFFDEFKRLQDENTMLRGILSTVLKSEHREVLTTEEILSEVKRLQDENSNWYMQADKTYCISDIVQRFKNLSPIDGQHLLYMENLLEYRKNGLFPSEYVDNQNDIIAVYDKRRDKFYPRYTLKGVRMVEDLLLSKGYELK